LFAFKGFRVILPTKLHTSDLEKLHVDSRNEAEMKPTNRSRITNGSAVLPGVDGRSTWVRRLRDLVSLHLSDLGGEDAVSEAEKSIVRRAATLTVELEGMEAAFAVAGEAKAADLDLYQRTAGNLRRLLESVGLERRAKDVTPPSLRDYINSKGAAA
jgi:hypothetical protein